MSEKYKMLKKVEENIHNLCLSRRLHTEADHLKRIKCTKTIRLFINLNNEDDLFLRIDSRVINDFKNNIEMKLYQLVKKVCIIFNSNLETNVDYYSRLMKKDGDGKDIADEKMNEVNNDGDEAAKKEIVIFEWNNKEDEIEAFELKSKLKPSDIKLTIEFENPRNIYKLSHQLRKVLNKYTETKPNVITGIWKYIHKNNILKPGDTEIRCNDELKEIFDRDIMSFIEIPDLLANHLYPIDSLVIDIPLKSEYNTIIDIPLEVDDLYHHPRFYSKNVYGLERKIEMVEQFKKRLEDKKKILTEYYKNPVSFINKWICLESSDYHNKTQFFIDMNIQEHLYELLSKLE